MGGNVAVQYKVIKWMKDILDCNTFEHDLVYFF